MWMRTELKDYGLDYNKIPLYYDSQSVLAISYNPVQHSRTKHINVRYHFIKKQVERVIIELYFVRPEYQLADMLTKPLSQDRLEYLVRRLDMRCLTLQNWRVLQIISSPKFDSLLEVFSDELAHIDLISTKIDEADFDPEEEIRLVKRLLYDNSSPRPPEEFNSENSDAIIESFSLSPMTVEDSDSLMDEIDLFLTLDDSMPSGIENDDYDSEGDIFFLE
nr:retrovirus-related Pol polyprotein from transposon TNT 1-94 [Tanacetum cinerariifolium]